MGGGKADLRAENSRLQEENKRMYELYRDQLTMERDQLTQENAALRLKEQETNESLQATRDEEEKKHKDLMSNLESALANLKNERENMRYERDRERKRWEDEKKARTEEEKTLMKVSVQDYAKKEEKQFKNYLNCVAQIPDDGKTIKPSVAFLGKTSVGKSTMINKIYGTKCKTSPLRCTQGAELVASSDDLDVYDVFGVNDEETYAELDVLRTTKRLHMVVCIYTDAVDHVLKLARLLNALDLDIIFVRNKCEDFDAEESRDVKQHDERKLLGLVKKERFLGVIIGSSKTGLGMKGLSETIAIATNPRIMDDQKIDDTRSTIV